MRSATPEACASWRSITLRSRPSIAGPRVLGQPYLEDDLAVLAAVWAQDGGDGERFAGPHRARGRPEGGDRRDLRARQGLHLELEGSHLRLLEAVVVEEAEEGGGVVGQLEMD